MITLINGDSLEVLPTLAPASFDLVFADPPFGISYAYDVHDDNMSRADYLSFATRWLSLTIPLLAPHGSLFIAIGDDYVADYKLLLDSHGLTMRNWIIWHYTFGVYCTHKFGRDHTHILYYTRSPDHFTFNADSISVPSARQTTYADTRANPAGRVPGDVWTYSRVCGTFKERNAFAHGCQMPESLLERIILATTHPQQSILDPFAGSGTTLAVAKKLNRHATGIELSPNYCEGISKRLAAIQPSLFD